jgi:hypothetical protein
MILIMKTYFSPMLRTGMRLIFIMLLGMATISCEDFFISDATNVDIPGSQPQLVVNSYISPQDTIIRVFVKRSVPYTQKPSAHVPVLGNADVYMARKGGEFLKLKYSEQLVCFILDPQLLNIEANTYYLLKVETHDGDYAEAECFVPGLQLLDINISTPVPVTNQWGDRLIEVDWSFRVDAHGGEKYFRTGGYSISYNFYEMDGEIFSSPGYYNEMNIEKGTPYVLDKNGSIYSFKAQAYTSPDYYDPITGLPVYSGNFRNDSIFIYIIQSDFNYYRFHTSLENYFYYDDGFPFAESVRIYSNVKNALGTFGGYNRQTFYVR